MPIDRPVVSSIAAQQRQLLTAIPGPRSLELAKRRTNAVATAVSSVMPVFVECAEGAIVRDVDGNSLIDLGSGIAVTGVGHAHPAVVAAIRAQADRFNHTCFMVSPYEGYVAVCEELATLTPGRHEKRSALFNSGAEAIENAVKVARRFTGRSAIAVFDHAYHGRTNLTMALTAKNRPYKDGFGPFAPEVYRLPMSYPFRDPDGLSGKQAAARAIEQLEVQVGTSNVACVLIEPILGEGGFVVPAPGFLPALAEWCRDSGVLFVADEVQTGFCRTGQWFACQDEAVTPDVVVTAKGIAAGMPLSAITGRADVMECVPAGGLGGTYGGNPVACATALASIGIMRELELDAAAQRIGARVLSRLAALQKELSQIGDVRGRGAMLAVELVKDNGIEPHPTVTQAIAKRCHENGVILLTCGTYGNVIRLLPPLVIDHALLDEGIDVLTDALRAELS